MQGIVGIVGQLLGDGQAAGGAGVGIFKPDICCRLGGQCNAAVYRCIGHVCPHAAVFYGAYQRAIVTGGFTAGSLGHSVVVGVAAAVRQGQLQRVLQHVGVDAIRLHRAAAEVPHNLAVRVDHGKVQIFFSLYQLGIGQGGTVGFQQRFGNAQDAAARSRGHRVGAEPDAVDEVAALEALLAVAAGAGHRHKEEPADVLPRRDLVGTVVYAPCGAAIRDIAVHNVVADGHVHAVHRDAAVQSFLDGGAGGLIFQRVGDVLGHIHRSDHQGHRVSAVATRVGQTPV